MAIAVILARGGSKRIPDKNKRLFCGKPILSYPIKAALESDVFSDVIVSTDCPLIADIAKEHGANVPALRPRDLADDHATTDQVLQYEINASRKRGIEFDYACCLYGSSPFVRPQFLQEGMQIIQSTHATAAFTVTQYSYPIHRAFKVADTGRLALVWPEHRHTRSQDMLKAYHDAGQFYWVNVEKYLKEQYLFSDDAVPIILPNWLVHDIDTLDDWRRAELIFETAFGK